MVSFPHCKINLGLHVLGKRADGYHGLETVFYPLPLKDVLEILPSEDATPPIPASAQAAAPFNLIPKGLPIPGDPGTNLCAKAWHLLKKDFPNLPPVDCWLYKNIPLGAGLGGGSSDGASMLKMLDRKFHLELGREKLTAYALQLGSDCPFFLYDQPCFATGRGEQLEPIALDLSGYSIVLVYPGIHIGTADAFSALHPKLPGTPLKESIAQPVSQWRRILVNDFEEPIFRIHPELQKIKDKLYGAGAVYASMTGSGSAFYGLFPRGERSLPDPGLFPGYFFRIL
jgi:4-diphosphocytidyl-2-C-methyl-D-erythritol kinase